MFQVQGIARNVSRFTFVCATIVQKEVLKYVPGRIEKFKNESCHFPERAFVFQGYNSETSSICSGSS